MNNEISEVKKKIIRKWEGRLPEFLALIEAEEKAHGKAGIPPQTVSTILAICLDESSRGIERYSKMLACLTLALVILTGVLAARMFFH